MKYSVCSLKKMQVLLLNWIISIDCINYFVHWEMNPKKNEPHFFFMRAFIKKVCGIGFLQNVFIIGLTVNVFCSSRIESKYAGFHKKKKQEAHGPHRSPEKLVQIIKRIWLYQNVDSENKEKRIYWFFIWTNLNSLHPRMLCAKFGSVVLEKKD